MSFFIRSDGWVREARKIVSPNFDSRPAWQGIDLLVIHCISLPRGQYGGSSVADLFTNQLDVASHPSFADLNGVKVSSHFFIRRDGELVQFVSCLNRAWHAGTSHWRGRARCNDFSIGVELEGVDDERFTFEQYAVLNDLQRALQARYPLRAIAGHSDIAPGRKTDPGLYFDWSLAHQGLPRDASS
jgi:AmpD protein